MSEEARKQKIERIFETTMAEEKAKLEAARKHREDVERHIRSWGKSKMEKEEEEEAKKLEETLKAKRADDKEVCKRVLKAAGEVEEKKDETLYGALFGLIVKNCVDEVLKKEVLALTTDMCLFRNYISEKMMTDETVADDTPMNIAALPKGFEEAWQVWRQQSPQEKKNQEAYKALKSCIIPDLIKLTE